MAGAGGLSQVSYKDKQGSRCSTLAFVCQRCERWKPYTEDPKRAPGSITEAEARRLGWVMSSHGTWICPKCDPLIPEPW